MIFYFILPVLTIAILYYRILKSVKMSATSMIMCDHQRAIRLRRNKRVSVTVVALLVTFVCFVFPHRVIWIIHDSNGLKNASEQMSHFATLFADIPYSFLVATNPIIYSLVNTRFRRQVRNMSKHLIWKRTNENISMSLQVIRR